MKVLRSLLFPFAILYRIASGVRNHLYNIGHKRSFRFEVPVICVGNLNVGGSGKTPTIEYLIRQLKGKHRIATLSRGYGRRTRGLRFAGENDSAVTVGDEPFQFYKNFAPDVKVVVGEDRAFAIPHIIQEFPETSLILLDDGYQHRRVNPQFNILLTDFEQPFFSDSILPVGNLRESKYGARRAHAIVVTKCPAGLASEEKKKIKSSITKYADDKPVFFSTIQYATPEPFYETVSSLPSQVVLLSGIARPDPFEKYAQGAYRVLKHFRYPDHHLYSREEIKAITEFIISQPGEVALLTTEKDMVRLLAPEFKSLLERIPCFYLPIHMVFDENGPEFDGLVQRAIESES